MPRGVKNSGNFKPGHKGMGGRPPIPQEVKEMARAYTQQAVQALADVLLNEKSKPGEKVMAANSLLDRGYGKPSQHIEANVNVLDTLSLDDRRALLAALDSIPGSSAEGESGTQTIN